MKEGAKRASSITWNGKDVVAAAIAKYGARQLRQYLAVAYPQIARQYVQDEINRLESKNPGLGAKARAEAVEKLRAADQAAADEVARCSQALAQAMVALEAGRKKQARAREALETFATPEELDKFQLPPMAVGSDAEASSSTTPFTQPGMPQAKKAKIADGKAKMVPTSMPSLASEMVD